MRILIGFGLRSGSFWFEILDDLVEIGSGDEDF